jgi:nucleotide-binding universal stress UspA family protein
MTKTFHKILCPIDFDDNSMAALALACKVAAQNDASLDLSHAVAIPAHSTEMPPEALKPYPEHKQSLSSGTLLMSESLAQSGLRPVPQPISGGEIIAAAKDLDADSIVMGSAWSWPFRL